MTVRELIEVLEELESDNKEVEYIAANGLHHEVNAVWNIGVKVSLRPY